MKTVVSLVSYTVAVGLLLGCLVSGGFWLVQPDPSLKQEPRVAPIPPRIAESIDRKRMPVPEPAIEPALVKPAMIAADAALTHQPPKIKIRELSRPPTKRKPPRAHRAVVAEAAAVPARVVSTGRSDFPY